MTNTQNNTVWQKSLTIEEYERVSKLTKSAKRVAVIPATIRPVRTNNFKNFAKDFFLPTTVNHAIHVNHNVGKVFAILGALILDTLTSPFRIVTALPRTISNHRKPVNPLYKYLKKEGVDKKIFASDHVKVEFAWERPGTFPTRQWTDENGVKHAEYTPSQHTSEEHISFIVEPEYKGWAVKTSTST